MTSEGKFESFEELKKYFILKMNEALMDSLNIYSYMSGNGVNEAYSQKSKIKKSDLLSLYLKLINAIYIEFRAETATNATNMAREKSENSTLRNGKKEFIDISNAEMLNMDKDLQTITKEDIDQLVLRCKTKTIDDFFGSNIILFSNAEIKVDPDKDEYKELLKKSNVFEKIGITSEEEVDAFIEKLRKYKKITHINEQFLDGDIFTDKSNNECYVPEKSFNSNVKTKKEYYEQRIQLLELLTQSSIKCNNGSCCIGQMDTPAYMLCDEISEEDIETEDITGIVKKLNSKFEESYDNYIPFDEQLRLVKDEYSKFTIGEVNQEVDKETQQKYNQELELLNNNLMCMKNDLYFNEILKVEMLRALEIVSKKYFDGKLLVQYKEIVKENGFVAKYFEIIFKDNPDLRIELQGLTEFRNKLAKDGNASHNAELGKGITEEFYKDHYKLIETTGSQEEDEMILESYFKFLNSINYDKYRIGVDSNNPDALKLKRIVDKVKSKIKIKNEKKLIDSLNDELDSKGATFYTTSSSHSVSSKQDKSVSNSSVYALEDLLKGRHGITLLSEDIKEVYEVYYRDKVNDVRKQINDLRMERDSVDEDIDIYTKDNDIEKIVEGHKLYRHLTEMIEEAMIEELNVNIIESSSESSLMMQIPKLYKKVLGDLKMCENPYRKAGNGESNIEESEELTDFVEMEEI